MNKFKPFSLNFILLINIIFFSPLEAKENNKVPHIVSEQEYKSLKKALYTGKNLSPLLKGILSKLKTKKEQALFLKSLQRSFKKNKSIEKALALARSSLVLHRKTRQKIKKPHSNSPFIKTLASGKSIKKVFPSYSPKSQNRLFNKKLLTELGKGKTTKTAILNANKHITTITATKKSISQKNNSVLLALAKGKSVEAFMDKQGIPAFAQKKFKKTFLKKIAGGHSISKANAQAKKIIGMSKKKPLSFLQALATGKNIDKIIANKNIKKNLNSILSKGGNPSTAIATAVKNTKISIATKINQDNPKIKLFTALSSGKNVSKAVNQVIKSNGETGSITPKKLVSSIARGANISTALKRIKNLSETRKKLKTNTAPSPLITAIASGKNIRQAVKNKPQFQSKVIKQLNKGKSLSTAIRTAQQQTEQLEIASARTTQPQSDSGLMVALATGKNITGSFDKLPTKISPKTVLADLNKGKTLIVALNQNDTAKTITAEKGLSTETTNEIIVATTLNNKNPQRKPKNKTVIATPPKKNKPQRKPKNQTVIATAPKKNKAVLATVLPKKPSSIKIATTNTTLKNSFDRPKSTVIIPSASIETVPDVDISKNAEIALTQAVSVVANQLQLDLESISNSEVDLALSLNENTYTTPPEIVIAVADRSLLVNDFLDNNKTVLASNTDPDLPNAASTPPPINLKPTTIAPPPLPNSKPESPITDLTPSNPEPEPPITKPTPPLPENPTPISTGWEGETQIIFKPSEKSSIISLTTDVKTIENAPLKNGVSTQFTLDPQFTNTAAATGNLNHFDTGRFASISPLNDASLGNFNYTAWGKWAIEEGNFYTDKNGNTVEIANNYWVIGEKTNLDNMPKTGSAIYNGVAVGDFRSTEGNIEIGAIHGKVRFQADFTNQSLSGGMVLKKNGQPFASPQLIIPVAFSNEFASPFGKNGFLNGFFYGSNAEELGGTWVTDSDDDSGSGEGIYRAKSNISISNSTSALLLEPSPVNHDFNTQQTPSALVVDDAVFNDLGDYNYTTWGDWETKTLDTINPQNTVTHGYWIDGNETPLQNLPKTGTATYAGGVIGDFTPAGGVTNIGAIQGAVNLQVNFSNQTIAADMQLNKNGVPWDATSMPPTNLNGTAWNGTMQGQNSTGTLQGNFYGPNAEEAAGVWNLNNPKGQAIGAFRAKK